MHREQIRVPLVFRAPGLVARGRRIEELVGLVDVTPTLLDLLGLPRPAWMQGASLAAALAPDGDARPPSGRTLAIVGLGEEGARATAWKMKLGRPSIRWNLGTDPGELRPRPVSADETARVRRILDAACARGRRLVAEAGADAAPPRDGGLSIDEQLRLRALGYLE